MDFGSDAGFFNDLEDVVVVVVACVSSSSVVSCKAELDVVLDSKADV